MRYLRVRYRDNRYDYVPDFMLDVLISSNEIAGFYRPSQKRWVIVGRDLLRGSDECADETLPRRRSTDVL
ncbi:MAG: hypothetical protein A4E57_00212 [Syntrophorhabdaceae bacterium PtaU1.Bin034]|jgi:hypothetical protein|nr:MAG: hypothetical protein A4E57_00212 [Syntrophorhabdaceae bacterium PtaU1.Bin034]